MGESVIDSPTEPDEHVIYYDDSIEVFCGDHSDRETRRSGDGPAVRRVLERIKREP